MPYEEVAGVGNRSRNTGGDGASASAEENIMIRHRERLVRWVGGLLVLALWAWSLPD